MRQKKQQHAEKQQAISVEYDGHMDMVMTHALLESLFTIFSTMVKLQIQPGMPVPKQNKTSMGEVSGLIGMKAQGASGSIALCLTLPIIREISKSLLGQEISCVNTEAMDLTGELTNMLVGGAKKILSEKGHDFDMQIPKLQSGIGHEIVHHHPGQTVLLPIRIQQDEFYIELNFV